jgi:hypothetical protein
MKVVASRPDFGSKSHTGSMTAAFRCVGSATTKVMVPVTGS